jgi:hypothetical protein
VPEAFDKAAPIERARKWAAWERIKSLPLVPIGDPDELKRELDEIRGGSSDRPRHDDSRVRRRRR